MTLAHVEAGKSTRIVVESRSKKCDKILYKGVGLVIELEENKRKILWAKEKLKSIGDSL